MPKKTTTITVNTPDQSAILAIALGTFIRLGWNPKYANDKIILGYTPRSGFKLDDEITIETAANQLTITSKLIHNESFDLMGKNKKHIAEFLSAFEVVKTSATDIDIEQWKAQLVTMGQETIKAAEKEIKDAEEVENVMNFSKSNLYVTYGIIAINTIIFIAMVASGINFMSPNGLAVRDWGATYPPFVFEGEWWRLFTSTFPHFGIIHLVLNMYVLYFVGTYLEPLLGKPRFIVAYVCTGILASLVSVIWHKDVESIGAGASGAIFGMFGVFLSLLITNVIPKQVKGSILQSVLFFVGFNVFYGFKSNSGIDNSAHLGGLFSGIIIGFAYYLTYRKPAIHVKATISLLVVALTVATVFLVLGNTKESDNSKFTKAIDEFYKLEEQALKISNNTTGSNYDYAARLKDSVLSKWNKAVTIMKDADTLNLSGRSVALRKFFQHYSDLRIQETNLIIKANEEISLSYKPDLDSIQSEMKRISEEIQSAK